MRQSFGAGMAIVIIGLLYLFLKMGFIHLSSNWTSASVLWPLVFVAFGLLALVQHRGRKIPWTTLFIIAYCSLLSMKHTREFNWLNRIGDVSLFFGLLVVGIGLSLALPWNKWFGPMVVIDVNKGRRRRQSEFADQPEREKADLDVQFADASEETTTSASGTSDGTAHAYSSPRSGRRGKVKVKGERTWLVIGDLSYGRTPWVLKDMNIWNGIGDVRVNLATAHVEDATHILNIDGWIGDVRVLVPADLPVLVAADVAVGNVSVFGESHSGTGRSMQVEDATFASAVRRCRLDIHLRIGDIEVVRV